MIKLDIVSQNVLVCMIQPIVIDFKRGAVADGAGINHVNEEPKPTGSVASGRAGEERTETVCSRGQAARMVQVCQRAQLADSQIVSVRKKMLEIGHCIKGFPLKAAAALAGRLPRGGRETN